MSIVTIIGEDGKSRTYEVRPPREGEQAVLISQNGFPQTFAVETTPKTPWKEFWGKIRKEYE
jgi:hypothetical protein